MTTPGGAAGRSPERRPGPREPGEESGFRDRSGVENELAFAITEIPPDAIQDIGSDGEELAIPLMRIKQSSDAEVRLALAETEEVIELDDADIVPILDELDSVEAEMRQVMAEASSAALKETAPDDGRRLDLAAEYLAYAPERIGELDDLEFTQGEVLAIAIRLANRDPEAFLNATVQFDFMLEPEERIAITQGILEKRPELFNRAVWQLGLSNQEIRGVLLDAPHEMRTTALQGLAMPGTVGGREVPVEPSVIEDHRKWYEKLVDQLKGKEKEESLAEREVRAARRAERNMRLALESAYPERVAHERERAQVEEELHGRIEALDDLGAGSANAPMWIRYKERPSPAVYKPRNRETPLRQGIPVGTYANREWLAYQIDKALQMDLVPPTVLRDGPEGVGAVQDWKVGAPQDRRYWLRESGDPKQRAELAKLAFFDMVTQNSDRHVGNWLISPDGKAIGIDHGSILGAPVSGHDGVRSWPMWAVEGMKVPDEIAEKVTAFAGSRDVQLALYDAFKVALGEDAERAWGQFIGSMNSVMNEGFPTSEQLAEQGNAWVRQDAKARDLFAGGKGD